MEFQYIKATEFCTSVRDGTHDTPKQKEEGYKLVTGKHIKNGVIDSTDAYYISEEDYNKINERSLVEQWDVLMSMIGTVGEVAVVKNTPDYAIKNIALFKCGGSELKGKWLSYYLKTPEAIGHMTGNQKGSSQQFLSLKQLRELPIAVTSEKCMKRIIDVLSVYDELIENNQKQIILLREVAQRLYKEWFIHLRYPGYEDLDIIDGLPEGWSNAKVTDLLEIKYGKDHKALEEGDIPVYGSGGIMRKVQPVLYSGESVLIPRKGSLNNILFVEGDFWTIDTMFYSIPRLENVAKYAYLHLCGLDMYSFNIGAAVPSMTTKILSGMDIVLPSKQILQQFEEQLSPVFARMKCLEMQCETAAEARDRLLPKLMSGEIEL